MLTTVEILGIKINIEDYETAISHIKRCILLRAIGRYICLCPVHSIVVSQKDSELKDALNNSFLTLADGMPVVWAANLLGASIRKNVRGTFLMLKSCEMAETNGHSVFFYGGKPETLEKMKHNLLKRYPRLNIVGIHSPPFRTLTSEETAVILDMINSKAPDILFVGLGAPKQEKWIANHSSYLTVPVSLCVGAAFDFLSGEKKQAPIWMQVRGLEWLHRLLNEPKRLAVRYLVYNPVYVFLFVKQVIKDFFLHNRLS